MAKEGIPILDRDHNEIGRYPFDWPNEILGGGRRKYPPAILRIKARKTKAGKHKNGGPDRLFAFDGECAAGVYIEGTVEDFAL